jgi:DNA polymerase III subunit alpha
MKGADPHVCKPEVALKILWRWWRLYRPGPLGVRAWWMTLLTASTAAPGCWPIPIPDLQHPSLKPILEPTYGVILYQEQVMQIAQELAGYYSLGGADLLRRAMGKKKPEEMEKQREVFESGAKAKGIDAQLAIKIFDLVEKFAGYGFNKSHSAAYALVAYQTAWLKAHYPAEFMAAVISADMHNTDKVVTFIDECRHMGLKVLPPDVNSCGFRFTANAEGHIVYGLGAIKGLGEAPIEAIVSARDDGGPFTNLFDFCRRIDLRTVNKRALEALIRAGALDCITDVSPDEARARLMASLQDTVQAAEQSLRNQAAGVLDMFGDISPVAGHGDSGTLLAASPWSQQQRLREEKETLGLYLSGHPIDEFLSELSGLTKDRLVNVKSEREPQWVGGLLVGVRTMRNKRGDLIAFLTLDDRSARLEISLFAKEYEQYRDILEKDAILLVECQVSTDEFSGGMRGRAKQVLNLVQARQRFANAVELIVQADRLSADFSHRLADCLRPYCQAWQPETPDDPDAVPDDPAAAPRPCRVRIRYERPDVSGWLQLGEQWSVRPEQSLLQELGRLCAPGTVTIAYQQS